MREKIKLHQVDFIGPLWLQIYLVVLYDHQHYNTRITTTMHLSQIFRNNYMNLILSFNIIITPFLIVSNQVLLSLHLALLCSINYNLITIPLILIGAFSDLHCTWKNPLLNSLILSSIGETSNFLLMRTHFLSCLLEYIHMFTTRFSLILCSF